MRKPWRLAGWLVFSVAGSVRRLPECQATGYSVRRLPECQVLPAQSDGFASSLAGMPGNWLLSQTVERCKIFESKALPYGFEKIFDRDRSTLMLIPQIRNLGSCFVEFLQSSFRYFLINDAFFLTIMLKVALLTEYHASNHIERLHQFSICLLQKAKTKI